MARIVKFLLVFIAGVLGLAVVASVAILLFVDPNDYRDEISAGVRDATGRELVIDGELSLSVFPWLAVEVGRTSLGNAPGFSDGPFLKFERAHLSVRMLPLIINREAAVGTATLEGLVVNLEVAADGSTNWDDLGEGGDTAAAAPAAPASSGEVPEFSVGNIRVAGANVSYSDAQAGSRYTVTNLDVNTEAIGANVPFDFDAVFDFAAAPDGPGGNIAIRGTTTMSDGAAAVKIDDFNVSSEIDGITSEPVAINFDARSFSIDTVAQQVSPGEMDLSVLGLSMAAKFEPFSYADEEARPRAELRVAEFSLKDLMAKLDIEPPATADERALGRVSFGANAVLGPNRLNLRRMTLELDDSTMKGNLSVPLVEGRALRFDLEVDTINLDGYMAPPDATATAPEGEADDVEIPVDLIRALVAEGSFRIRQAYMSGLEFTDLEVGLNSRNGKLRLQPLGAKFYEGQYTGDVSVDASGDVPSISVDEKLAGVNLQAMARALFEQENLTGTINGSFALAGSGRNLAAIRKDIDGTMSIELADGAWEGTDVWHEMRKARAMFKRENPPEATLPARTEFTSVSATGKVTDGIFENNDLLIELPFLRITGGGIVDLPAGEIDYSVEARISDKPELMSGVSQAEIDDFTRTVVPIRISGPLASPSIRPDIEEVFRQQVEGAIEEETERLKERLLKDLIGGDDESGNEEAEEKDLEDQLKEKLLQDLIPR